MHLDTSGTSVGEWARAGHDRSHDRQGRLRAFGLSEYASRTYLALLELGTTEARDVSRLAKVPVAKIYATLDQLQEKGLVIVSPETPKKYTPLPFASFVDRLRQEHEMEATRLAEERDELASLFPIVGTREMNDRGSIVTLRGRERVLEKLTESITSAERDILAMLSMGSVRRVPHLMGALQEAAARDVRIRLLVPPGPADPASVRQLQAVAQLRERPLAAGQALNVSTVAVDEERVLAVHYIPDDGSRHGGKDVALCVDEAGLASAFATLLETKWAHASPLGRRVDVDAGDSAAKRRSAAVPREEGRAP